MHIHDYRLLLVEDSPKMFQCTKCGNIVDESGVIDYDDEVRAIYDYAKEAEATGN